VGLADGIRQTALELSNVVVNGEAVVTCTTYEYDVLSHLVYMRMLTLDRKQVLVLTEFEYEGAETCPFRTVVKSLAEGRNATSGELYQRDLSRPILCYVFMRQ